MKFYELTYALEDEAYERFSALAERFNKVKGWNEKNVLQFAVTATCKEDIETKLQFLESQIVSLEEENSEEKQVYISEEERKKCRKVLNAFAEEIEKSNMLVVEAGRYGFVKLQYYRPPYGFDDAITFNNSQFLFNDLWEEWLYTQLNTLSKDTPMAHMDYEEMFKCLSQSKQDELMAQREYFAKKAELTLN